MSVWSHVGGTINRAVGDDVDCSIDGSFGDDLGGDFGDVGSDVGGGCVCSFGSRTEGVV